LSVESWTEDEVRAFLAEFDLRPRHLDVARLESWWSNLVLRLDADGERLVLRRYGLTPPDEVRWELALLDHLRARDFPTIAPRRRAGGDTLGSFRGRPAILYPYVEGANACARGAPDDLDPLYAIAETTRLIARLHSYTRDLTLPHPRVQSGSDSRRTIRQLLQVVEQRGVAPHERALATFAGQAARALEAFAARIAPHEPDLPRGIVHHDAHCANVLFHQGKLVALIDFDDACPSFLVSDLSVMLAGWAIDRQTYALLPERAAHLIRAYEHLRPLTPAERDLLPDFLLLFTVSDDCATIISELERGASADDSVAQCVLSRAFLAPTAGPSWRSVLAAACQ
jgi:homoserine kinase type II